MIQKHKQYIPLFYFLLIAVIVFANNGRVSLWDQDEAAYAGFAKGMVTSGNWLIPDFMWSDMHRKPPLHFWDISVSYLIFGINEFAVRFPSALFLLFTYMLTYFAGSPLFGKRMAFLGTVVLSTSLFIPSLAKVSVTDATLLFYSTVCAFGLINIMNTKSVKWLIAFWTAFGLALLTKGPPIILFTGVFAALLFIFHPNRKNIFYLQPWFFLPLACLPLFIWGYFVWQQDNGVFITWMLDWYILKRVNSSVLGQTGPPGTHLLMLFFFFIPYFMFLPKTFINAVSGLFKKDGGIHFFLSAWFIAGWFLYEWSPSKLPTYIIAAHVPFALLIGKELLNAIEERKLPMNGWIITHFIFITFLFAAFIIAPEYLHLPALITFPLIVTGIMFLLISCILIYFLRSENFIRLMIASNLLFQFILWIFLLPMADPLKNGSKRIADYIAENAPPHSTILIANDEGHPPSLPFYLKMHFERVQEPQSLDSMLIYLKSNDSYVVILNERQKKITEHFIPSTQFTEIKSMLTDREEKASYYIAFNKKTKKGNVTASK